jgi:hypothetical protein
MSTSCPGGGKRRRSRASAIAWYVKLATPTAAVTAAARVANSIHAAGGPLCLDGSPTVTDSLIECNVSQRNEEEIMRIKFVAKDPDSVPNQSPTLYRTDRRSWLVQGWVVTDPAALAEMAIPEGETVVEIPDRLVPFFQEG